MRAEALDDARDVRGDLLGVRDVARVDLAGAALLADDPLRLGGSVEVAVDARDRRALAGEQHGDRLAVAPAGLGRPAPRDERDLAVEPQHLRLAWWSRPRNVLAHALVCASALSLITGWAVEHRRFLPVRLEAIVGERPDAGLVADLAQAVLARCRRTGRCAGSSRTATRGRGRRCRAASSRRSRGTRTSGPSRPARPCAASCRRSAAPPRRARRAPAAARPAGRRPRTRGGARAG